MQKPPTESPWLQTKDPSHSEPGSQAKEGSPSWAPAVVPLELSKVLLLSVLPAWAGSALPEVFSYLEKGLVVVKAGQSQIWGAFPHNCKALLHAEHVFPP